MLNARGPKTALLALLLTAAGCGAPAGNPGNVEPMAVGAACANDDECRDELTCVTELPGGFCTMRCERDCPEGSWCSQVTFQDRTTETVCLPLCDAPEDCRSPYQCVSIGTRKVCGG